MTATGAGDDYVVVGRIGPAHGLRGEVFVEPRTDEPERRFATGSRLDTSGGPLTVAGARTHSGRLVVRFEEIADRTAAEASRGTELSVAIDAGESPEDPEEFYDHQLVGLRVETTTGEVVGELERVEHNAAQDLLVIRTPEREVLFPFVSALVPEVDVHGGRIVLDDRPGSPPRGALMRIDVVTIFPEYLEPLGLSLPGKARESGLLDVHVHDLRDWTHDRHRTVDDTPYGGGAGMVMKPEPWGEALDAVAPDGATLVVPTPSGRPFTQAVAAELADREHLVFACGRYEGIDQRVIDDAASRMEVREVSVGDYVLNGGEVATLAIIEAVARLLPGFMGNAESLSEESFAEGLLEYPVYTKPAELAGARRPRRAALR